MPVGQPRRKKNKLHALELCKPCSKDEHKMVTDEDGSLTMKLVKIEGWECAWVVKNLGLATVDVRPLSTPVRWSAERPLKKFPPCRGG